MSRARDLVGLSTPEARLVAIPAGLAALALVGPDRLDHTPSLCLVRRVFGRCPTCGVTRATAALARGDVSPRRRRGLAAAVLGTLGAVLLSDARRLLAARGPVEVCTVIDAELDEVWRHVADIGSHWRWMHDAEAIRFTSERTRGVGTTFEADTRIGPFHLVDPMEVTEWEEREVIGISHGGAVTGKGRFSLQPLPGGRTRFTWTEELAFPWWLGGTAGSALAAQVLRRVWRRNLATLKAHVEPA
jgi:uncharacterized membrane protein